MVMFTMSFPIDETKICRDCREELPLDNFSRNGKKDGYRRPECRSCQHKKSKDINPNYQNTKGTKAARSSRKMQPSEVKAIKIEKLKEQNYQCVYCVASINEANSHLDHITPLAQGGGDEKHNLQALCKRCNSEKHSKSHIEYVRWLRDLGEHLKPDRRKDIFS